MYGHSVYRAGHDSRPHILLCTQADSYWSGTQTGPFRMPGTCNLESWIHNLDCNMSVQPKAINKHVKLKCLYINSLGGACWHLQQMIILVQYICTDVWWDSHLRAAMVAIKGQGLNLPSQFLLPSSLFVMYWHLVLSFCLNPSYMESSCDWSTAIQGYYECSYVIQVGSQPWTTQVQTKAYQIHRYLSVANWVASFWKGVAQNCVKNYPRLGNSKLILLIC